jgi:hypothetical protein
MGTLIYGSQRLEIPMGDAVLARLLVVASSKLRRRENFLLSWTTAGPSPERLSVMITWATDLRFAFEGPAMPRVSPDAVKELMRQASGPAIDLGVI